LVDDLPTEESLFVGVSASIAFFAPHPLLGQAQNSTHDLGRTATKVAGYVDIRTGERFGPAAVTFSSRR
jgi:hypothetical protein